METDATTKRNKSTTNSRVQWKRIQQRKQMSEMMKKPLERGHAGGGKETPAAGGDDHVGSEADLCGRD
ncbi:hypothetical protein L1887_20208 [Cichorium endivia]|nr:hypothetical protein L1887_20208 [Cichorium endivia]